MQPRAVRGARTARRPTIVDGEGATEAARARPVVDPRAVSGAILGEDSGLVGLEHATCHSVAEPGSPRHTHVRCVADIVLVASQHGCVGADHQAVRVNLRAVLPIQKIAR